MRRPLTAILGAATIVATLGASGCSRADESTAMSSPAASPAISSRPPAPPTAPLPAPEALTDVLYRLADPAVPGTEKLNLVEGTTSDSAATLDKFTAALADSGYLPLTFDATNVVWSDADPAHVVATVTVATPKPDAGGRFSFPMEFKSSQGGWQLTRKTADMLLAFGNEQTGASPTPTP